MELSDAMASTASARAQMAFQERMSNTAVQRQVADMKAAGINPVLSAKFGGASTPEGASGDFSSVLGILGTSVDTSAKAVSRLGNTLEQVIKSGLTNGSNLAAFGQLKDGISQNFTSPGTGIQAIDTAINKFNEFLPDDVRLRTPFGSFSGKDIKHMLNSLEAPKWFTSAKSFLTSDKTQGWLKQEFVENPRDYFKDMAYRKKRS